MSGRFRGRALESSKLGYFLGFYIFISSFGFWALHRRTFPGFGGCLGAGFGPKKILTSVLTQSFDLSFGLCPQPLVLQL